MDGTLTEDQFADGSLVRAASLLDHCKRLANLSRIFKVAEEQDRIGEIAHVDRGLHGADEAVLCQRQNGSDALLAEIGKQLVKLHGKKLLMRHGIEKAVHAVDHHYAQFLV